VNLGRLSGTTINAWWYNPRDGTSQFIDAYAKSIGTQPFTPPGNGYGNDWVLVLDDAARGYNAPGVVSTTTDMGGSVAGSVSDGARSIPYRLFRPAGANSGQKFPLVLFLHGVGDSGTDNQRQLEWMGGLLNNTRSGPYAAYVLAPQIDTDMWFQSFTSTPTEGMKLTLMALHQVMNTENVDLSRIYVTGTSMGGMGAWDALVREPNLFAAAAPMSGGGNVATAATIKDIPVWAFHGSADPIVPVDDTRNMIDALRAVGGDPKYTEITGGGHVIWDPIYYDQSHTLYPWLFSQRRTDVAAAVPAPVASKSTAPVKAATVFSVRPVKVTKPRKISSKSGQFLRN
jgi:predicted esterase